MRHKVEPNSYTHRRRNSTVELSCVGGVDAPVANRDPAIQCLFCY